ncbi:MAG: hypothetical protein LLG45_13340 [Actinomycetia bacterium]|nr:hypothetical protein [Actinomycetes bacterium]
MIDEMLNQRVTIAKKAGSDGKGHYLYGNEVSYRARVQYKPRLVRTSSGDGMTNRFEKVSNARVYVEAKASIELGDKITLPDGSTPMILLVSPMYGDSDELAYWTVDV